MTERTEAPTPRRIRKARERGDVAVSAYASQAVAWGVGLLVMPAALAAMVERTSLLIRAALTPAASSLSLHAVIREVLWQSVPLLLVVGAVSAAVTLVQTRGLFAPRRVAFDAGRLDVMAGLASLFSAARVWTGVRALLMTFAVGALLLLSLRHHAAALASVAVLGRPDAALAVAGRVAQELGLRAAAIGLAIALVDGLLARRAFARRHKMSRSEVEREQRDAEGDPQGRSSRRQAHRELARLANAMAACDATVVLTAPTHQVKALRFVDGRDEVPILIAAGEGALGRRIEDLARGHGIPVVHDATLVHGLADLEIGDPIPAALYEPVAELLRGLDDPA